jgi:hypothetical protein
VSGRHVGRDGTMLYQSRQLDLCDWCLRRVSLFGVTQFSGYLIPLFLFRHLHFISFYVLSPHHNDSIDDSYFSPQILPRGALN